MSRSTVLFILFLLLVVMALGYNYFARPFASLFTPEQAAVTVASPAPILSPEQALLASLSTREKVLQLLAVPVTVSSISSPSATLTWSLENKPGFVTLFGELISTDSARVVIDQLTNDDPLPILIAVDHEGGSVQRLGGTGFTRLPAWRELCQLEEEKRKIVLAKSASELAAVGIDLVLAPMVDVASNSAVLGSRVCDDEPETVVTAGYQFATIFAEQGILPVYKHFPGIGQTGRDLHTQFDRVTVSADDALIYRSLLTLNPQVGVMVTHVGVENQYPDLPCSLSPACIGELQTTFPEVLVFSDALDMAAAAYNPAGPTKTLASISLEAVEAGSQVLIYGQGVTADELEEVVSTLEAAAANDKRVQSQLEAAVAAIIRYKTTK